MRALVVALALSSIEALVVSPTSTGARWLRPSSTTTPQELRSETPQELRSEKATALKRQLFEACAAFKEQEALAFEAAGAAKAEAAPPRRRWRLRRRGGAKTANEKVGGLLEAESFAAVENEYDAGLRARRDEIVEIIDALAPLNPTAAPLDGWKGRNGLEPERCVLNGRWALRFTNAADATFKGDGKSGAATTSQLIDSTAGLFVNCVDFQGDGKLKGFRVEVEGEPRGDSDMELIFKRIKLLRRSRFPRAFGTITIPLPNPKRLRRFGFRLVGKKLDPEKDRGAGFTLLYVDDTCRMHRTFDGLLFVQERLKDGEAE